MCLRTQHQALESFSIAPLRIACDFVELVVLDNGTLFFIGNDKSEHIVINISLHCTPGLHANNSSIHSCNSPNRSAGLGRIEARFY